jgi:hypothetical protein
VPVLGIGFGAGMNMQLAHSVADEAYYSYRERRLREKGDPPPGFPSRLPPADDKQPPSEEIVDIEGLLEEAAETAESGLTDEPDERRQAG